MSALDQEALDALRVYDTGLPRQPQWGDDFFGIEPFYIALGLGHGREGGSAREGEGVHGRVNGR